MVASSAASASSDMLEILRSKVTGDAPRFVYALNVALITALALALSFLLNIERSYWCLLTVALVAQASSGLTVWRSVARTLGTLVGCGFGLTVVAVFAQDSVAVLACLALWLFAVGFFARFEIGLDAYAYSTAGLTALVIVIDTGASADIAYGLAVARTTETLIGIFAAFVILLVVFPVSASQALLGGLRTARAGVMKLSRDAVLPGETIESGDTQAVARALAATYANLRAQKLERSHRRVSADKAEAVTNRLNRLLIDAGRLSLVLTGLREAMPDAISRSTAELDRLLAAAPAPDADKGVLREAASAFRGFVSRLDLEPAVARLRVAPDGEGSRELAALDAMRRFAAGVAALLDAEAVLADTDSPAPVVRRLRARFPDWPAAFMRGLRPAFVLVALATVWLASAGSSFRTLTLIGAAMILSLPAIAPRAVLPAGGKVIGLGMAAMILPVLALEAALPYVESFAFYAILVGAVMFVFFYVCYDPLRKTYALGGAIFLAVALQPANTQNYDPLSLFNAAATLAFLPLVVGGAFAIVFPENERWLRRRLRSAATRLLMRAVAGRDDHTEEFVAQSLDAIGDYGGDLDLKNPANRPDVDRAQAIAVAGVELYDLARMRRLEHLPPELGERLPGIGAAILSEARTKRGGTGGGEPDGVLREARNAALAVHARGEADDLSRHAALRFALGLELLSLLRRNGTLRMGN